MERRERERGLAAQQWTWVLQEREALTHSVPTVGEIPEELYQAQFLRPLRHIASLGMYSLLHTAAVKDKVGASEGNEQYPHNL